MLDESGVRRETDSGISGGIDQFEGPQLGDVAAQMAELVESLTNQLNDPVLGELVRLKLEGYTEEEIAEKQDCSVSTVRRRLAKVRDQWTG